MIKKILFALILYMAACFSIYAADAKVYFTESNGRIFYEDFDNTFMNHSDIIPGKEYTDYLDIENDTSIEYGLYVKFKNTNNSADANDLFDNINMKIYVDDVLVYDGSSRGIVEDNSNLSNPVGLVTLEPNSVHQLKVKTKLLESYSNIDYSEYSYINWVFYAEYSDNGSNPIIDPDAPYNPNNDDPNGGNNGNNGDNGNNGAGNENGQNNGNNSINNNGENNQENSKDLKENVKGNLLEIEKAPKTYDNIIIILVALLICFTALIIEVILKRKLKKSEVYYEEK